MASEDIGLEARAEGFQAELLERGDEIEAARRLPADLSTRFAEAGFYRMFAPREFAGLEVAPSTFARVVEKLAEADASSAWCVFIGATSASCLAALPQDAAQEIFDSPSTLIAGVFAPMGKAQAHEDGFVVSGKWQWGSGTQNADWVLAGCRFFEGGEPMTLGDGSPRTHMVVVPAAEVKFEDTWFTSGLCGTGSTDFELNEVFVPRTRIVGFSDGSAAATTDGPDRNEGRRPPRPLYAFPQFGLLGLGIASVALGLGRAAIHELVSLASAKTPQGSARPLALRATTQIGVSKAEAELRAARAFFYEAIDAAWKEAVEDGSISIDRRRDLRLATTHATRAAAAAVDRMYDLGGGTSVFKRSRLQRIFRDVHVATQHMMVAPATLELTGRLLLGLETDTRQL